MKQQKLAQVVVQLKLQRERKVAWQLLCWPFYLADSELISFILERVVRGFYICSSSGR